MFYPDTGIAVLYVTNELYKKNFVTNVVHNSCLLLKSFAIQKIPLDFACHVKISTN